MHRFFSIFLACFFVCPSLVAHDEPAQDEVLLLYENFYPYFYEENGAPSGEVYAPVQATFEAIGVSTVWQATSFIRIMKILKGDKGQVCAVGYSKADGEGSKYRYSREVMTLGPTIVLGRQEKSNLFYRHDTLSGLMNSRELRGGFGMDKAVWEEATKTTVPDEQHHIFIKGGEASVLKLLLARRIDYILYEDKAAERIVAETPTPPLAIYRYSKKEKERPLYLRCNQSFPLKTLDAFDRSVSP